ncbi:hypothetical protein MBLNU230_g2416t1 [Neophaeotheca triangularis]
MRNTITLAALGAYVQASPLLHRRAPCDPDTSAVNAPAPDPNTPTAFSNFPLYSSLANDAPTPEGYERVFSNLAASNSAPEYLTSTAPSSYDPALCAAVCDSISACQSFNIYFQRSPSVEPGFSQCQNPAAVSRVYCAYWGSEISAASADNAGGFRADFRVLIAGANGYVRSEEVVVTSSSTVLPTVTSSTEEVPVLPTTSSTEVPVLPTTSSTEEVPVLPTTSSTAEVPVLPTTSSTEVPVLPTTSSTEEVPVLPTTSSTEVPVLPTTSSTQEVPVLPTTSSTEVPVLPTTSSTDEIPELPTTSSTEEISVLPTTSSTEVATETPALPTESESSLTLTLPFESSSTLVGPIITDPLLPTVTSSTEAPVLPTLTSSTIEGPALPTESTTTDEAPILPTESLTASEEPPSPTETAPASFTTELPNGAIFTIFPDSSVNGVLIDLPPVSLLEKRQDQGEEFQAPSLADCIRLCEARSNCVVTTADLGTCMLYGSVNERFAAPGKSVAFSEERFTGFVPRDEEPVDTPTTDTIRLDETTTYTVYSDTTLVGTQLDTPPLNWLVPPTIDDCVPECEALPACIAVTADQGACQFYESVNEALPSPDSAAAFSDRRFLGFVFEEPVPSPAPEEPIATETPVPLPSPIDSTFSEITSATPVPLPSPISASFPTASDTPVPLPSPISVSFPTASASDSGVSILPIPTEETIPSELPDLPLPTDFPPLPTDLEPILTILPEPPLPSIPLPTGLPETWTPTPSTTYTIETSGFTYEIIALEPLTVGDPPTATRYFEVVGGYTFELVEPRATETAG